MSTIRYVTIWCDCDPCPPGQSPCGEESTPEPTAEAVRKAVRSEGWKLSKDRDLCPRCVAHG